MDRKMSCGVLTLILILRVSFAVFGEGQAEESYPAKHIDFLIPFGAGGGIIYTALKNSKADGYTVGWNSTSILTTTNIGNVPFSYEAFEYVCRVGFTSMPIAVLADAPWKTFEEFINYAKQNPGKIKIGNAGTGSATHLTAVIIEKKTGVEVVHVPLGAKRRIPSLLGGEVDMICVPLPEVAPQVQAGKARLLAMPTESRDPSFSDVPTLTELGYPIVVELFRGISVPEGTPAGIIKKLEEVFEKASKDPKFVDIAQKNGFNIDFKGRSAFEGYLKEQNQLIADGMKLGGLVK